MVRREGPKDRRIRVASKDMSCKMQLDWLPISLHHDGCTLLMKKEALEQRRRLEEWMGARLRESGQPIKGLEFTHYEMPEGISGAQRPEGRT